jgi:type IV pilus assembly protein PilM
MLDKANPQSKVSPVTFDRVKMLLGSIADSPFVAAVEAERFNNQQPGILGFDFVILVKPQRPL